MISSILKTAGLITLLFGAWVLFTVQSGKNTGTERLINKVSNLKASAISAVKPSDDKKEAGLASVSGVAANSASVDEKDTTQKEDNDGSRSKSTDVQTGKSASANLKGNAEDIINEKSGLLARVGHKENSSTDDTGEMFNTKTIFREEQAERTKAKSESEGRFDTAAEEATDVQFQSAQKRLAESIIKLETTINSFGRR